MPKSSAAQKKSTPQKKKTAAQTSTKKTSQSTRTNSTVKTKTKAKIKSTPKTVKSSTQNKKPSSSHKTASLNIIKTTPSHSTSAPASYPLASNNPPAPHKIRLGRVYTLALDALSRNAGPVVLAAAIYILAAVVLNLLNVFYFKSPFILGILTIVVLFILLLWIMVYYNDLLQPPARKEKNLWANWSRIIPGILVSIITFFLTFLAFLPFFLLSNILTVFAIASLNPFKVFELLFSAQFQEAIAHISQSSANSINWLIAAGIMILIGVIVAIYVSLKYIFVTIVVAAEKSPAVGSAINYSSYLSRGNKWRLVILNIFNGIINALGIICFGVGFLFTLPLTTLATIIAYYDAKGQLTS